MISLNEIPRTKFPDGMVAINLSDLALGSRYKEGVDIYGSIISMDDLFVLSQLVNLLRKKGVKKINFSMHYMLGSRMDRDMGGFPNITKSMCDFINSLSIDAISVVWPHSSSTIDRLDNCKHLVDIETGFIWWGISKILKKINMKHDESFSLVTPDAGAAKRFWNDHSEITKIFPNMRVVEGTKHRDTKTGKLSGFGVASEVDPVTIIVDDLCDGGGTFCGLAQELRKKGASSVGLVVYHGVFSKGFDLDGIDYIATSNSFLNASHKDLGLKDTFSLWPTIHKA